VYDEYDRLTRGNNIINSRNVIERIAELEAMRDGDEDLFTDDETEELAALLELQNDAGGSEWKHDVALIRDDYFERYAQELAKDIGAMEHLNHWPATCIDWERAAGELQVNYTMVRFAGSDYWTRAC
jgi:hypothetical protein